MTRYLLGALLLSISTMSLAGEKILHLQADLSLDPQGQPTKVAFIKPIPAKLESILNEQINTWHFEPVLVNAEPRSAIINLYLDVGVEEKAEQVHVRVVKAGTNLRILESKAPRYPRRELLAGRQGDVVAQVLVDEHGRVDEVKAVYATNEQFKRAALKSLDGMRFEPLLVDGIPAKAEVLLPMRFTVRDGPTLPPLDLPVLHGVPLDAKEGGFALGQGGQLKTGDI